MLDIVFRTPFQFSMFFVFLVLAFVVKFSKSMEMSAIKQQYRFPDPSMSINRFKNLRALGYVVESGLWLFIGYVSLQNAKNLAVALICLWFALDMTFLIIFTIFTEDCLPET